MTRPGAQAGQTLPPSVLTCPQSLRKESPYSARISPGSRQTPQAGTESVGAGCTDSIAPVEQDRDTSLKTTLPSGLRSHHAAELPRKGSPPNVGMDTLVSPVDASKSSAPAVDDILNRTREFVDVLKLLSAHQPSSPSTRGGSRQNPPRPRPLRGTSDDNTDSVCSTILSPAPVSSAHHISALDTGSLIAVLSSYIRVLHLHLVIFAHIHDHLKELSESDDPVLCPVPGLSFCTFAIRKSRPSQPMYRPYLPFDSESSSLQTTILIQVVTSLFERVESLLGLPREFRISTRKEEPRGLFGQHGIVEMAGPIIRKEDDGLSRITDKVASGVFGNTSKRQNSLLRDSIAP